jgi:hypothetical protein
LGGRIGPIEVAKQDLCLLFYGAGQHCDKCKCGTTAASTTSTITYHMASMDLLGNEPSFATSVDGYMMAIKRAFGLDVCNVDFIGTYIDHVLESFVSNDGVAVPSPTVLGGPVLDDLFGSWDGARTFDEETTDETAERRNHLPNDWGYAFGDIYKANWYTTFLAPDVRDRTYPLWRVDEFHL